MNLTLAEIEILLEAVDAWESAPGKSAVLGDMLGIMFSRSKDEAEEALRQTKMKKQAEERELEAKARSEKAIRLKVRLLDMRDELIKHQDADYLKAEKISWVEKGLKT